MSAGQRSIDKVLLLLGEAQSALEAARAAAAAGSFSAADLERLIAAEQQLAQTKTDAMELRRALLLTVHNLAKAVHEKTRHWPKLADGSAVRADYDSPRWSFPDAEGAERFLGAVIERLADLAPTEGAAAWAARRLAEVYPLRTKSTRVTHSGASALGVDPTEYQESSEGARDYKVVAPKDTKGGRT